MPFYETRQVSPSLVRWGDSVGLQLADTETHWPVPHRHEPQFGLYSC